MGKFVSETLCIPITSLHIIGNHLLVGEGGTLSSYCLQDCAPISTVSVFNSSRVHGITELSEEAQVHSSPEKSSDAVVSKAHGRTGGAQVKSDQNDDSAGHHGARLRSSSHSLVVYGGKNLCVASLDSKGCVRRVGRPADLGGWLLDVAGQRAGRLAALDAHGRLLRLRADRLDVLSAERCPDRCLLYSGALLEDGAGRLLAFCGTVFRQVLVWAPGGGGILHRLSGHGGVLFGLALDAGRGTLVSCSDDRTVRLWRCEGADWRRGRPAAAGVLFGHEARVWRALPVAGRVVSVGEDSRVCVWAADGRLERRWRAHQGASVRAAAADAAGRRLATGGGDGGVLLWRLDAAASAAPSALPPPPGDRARTLVALDGRRQLLATDAGRLLLLQAEPEPAAPRLVHADSRLASYALVAAAPDGRHVALAGIQGVLVTLRVDGSEFVKVGDQLLWDGKIYSCLWLTSDLIVACDGAGLLQLLRLDGSGVFVVERHHQLPPCKQRWLSAAALYRGRLVVADRDGGLHVFRPDLPEPAQSLRRLLGRHGATSLSEWDGRLLATGRDGSLRRLEPEPDQPDRLRQADCTRLPWSWVAGTARLDGALTLVAFHASEFVLWSVEAERDIWRVACGGGHRSWALSVGADRLWLSWVAERKVRGVCCPLADLRTAAVKPGLHSGATLSAVHLGPAADGGALLATAGEDTTVRLLSAAPGRPLRPLATLRAHISSVRVLCALRPTAAGPGLLLSAGGRAQLKLWRVTGAAAAELSSHMVRPAGRRPDDRPETRYMDLDARRRRAGRVTVAAAGSDGFVRLFSFSESAPRLTPVGCLAVGAHCLLRLRWLGRRLLATTTAGSAWLCRPRPESEEGQEQEPESEQEPEEQEQELEPERLAPPLHQSGVNAVAVLPEPAGGARLATGGDDGALCVSRLSGGDGPAARLKPAAREEAAHASQVTGVSWLSGDRLLSVSVDQRVCVWAERAGRLRPLTCHLTPVADVKGLLHWTTELGDTMVLVYGEGLELLRLDQDAVLIQEGSPVPGT